MQTVQIPKQVCYLLLVFLWDQVIISQIKRLRKRICGVEPTPLQVSSYTRLLHKVQDPFSACRQSIFRNKFLIFYTYLFFCGTKSQLHRSRNSGREFAGWNQLLCRSVLTPVSCRKFKIAASQIKKLRRRINLWNQH